MTEPGQTDKQPDSDKRGSDEATPKVENTNGDPVATESAPKPASGKPARPGDNGKGNKTQAPAKAKDKPRRGGGWAVALALLACLIALASAAGAGALWYWGQNQVSALDERTDTVERGLESNVQDVVLPRVQKLADAQRQLQQTSAQQADELEELTQALTQSRVQLGGLTEKIEGGRRRWQLLEIEDLLLAANERLLLYKDAGGAQQALNLAGARLGALNDPRLFRIRELVVDEVAALNALPKPDIEGMALSLTSLIQQIPQLPLVDKVSDDYSGLDEEDELQLPKAPWRHFLDSLRAALSGMLTIRREGSAHQPLMPPQQTFFLYQNLQLKLQAGRLALLQKSSTVYSDTLNEARDWLNTYFDTNDAAVAGAIEQLGQIGKIELDWEAPDISGSLEALRQYLSVQSTTNGSGGAEKHTDAEQGASAETGSE